MNKKTENFLAIIDENKSIIYKIVNAYCKNRDLHQDLTQEIILQLWASFDNYNSDFKISTWMYRIALNTAISYYRKGLNEYNYSFEYLPQYENLLLHDEPSKGDPNLEQLNQFIQELREIDKALILLYLDELNYNEISKIIGISPTNVGTKLSRIKILLRNKFQLKIKNNEG